jgi:hypothetical protein
LYILIFNKVLPSLIKILQPNGKYVVSSICLFSPLLLHGGLQIRCDINPMKRNVSLKQYLLVFTRLYMNLYSEVCHNGMMLGARNLLRIKTRC